MVSEAKLKHIPLMSCGLSSRILLGPVVTVNVAVTIGQV